MRAFVSGRLEPVALAISILVASVFMLPGLGWARVGDTCAANNPAVPQITICVSAVERPAGGCGACIPVPPIPGPASNVCPVSGQAPFNACCSNLSEAVGIAGPGDTIGVYTPTLEPAVGNVIITGPYGSPFNSNQNASPVNAGLQILECHNAKVTAGDPDSPVIDIKAGAGNVIINGIDVIGGSVGILAENSGTVAQPGSVLKGIRAEDNTADSVNLTQLFNATLLLTPSSSFPGFPATRGVDDNLATSWFSAFGNACNLGSCPSFEIEFPQDVTVTQLQMFGNREFPDGFDFLAGTFQLLSAGGTVLFDSGVVNLPAPNRDVILSTGACAIGGVRRVRFTATADESPDPGFAELKVFGSVGSGAGIEVRGNGNEVSGSTAVSNDIGFLVSGNGNLIRSNRGDGNTDDGFCVSGNVNDVRGNEANTNGAIGFDLVGTGNQLRSNQSNRSPQGGSKENGSCEYSFANSTTQDFGGNKKDNANFVGTIAGSPKRYAQGCYE